MTLDEVQLGDVLFVQAETPHVARDVGSSNGAERAKHVLEKGKRFITLVR